MLCFDKDAVIGFANISRVRGQRLVESFERIRAVKRVDRIPRTALGKLVRRAFLEDGT
jgi:acyl-coenzyme A synthetase/AMP-(fatty) acid ligase